MKENEIEFGRFRKAIKNMAFDELQSVHEFFNTLLGYRNYTEIHTLLPDIPSDNPGIWLSELLFRTNSQQLLIEHLKNLEEYADFVSNLKRLNLYQNILTKICSLPPTLSVKAIFAVGHELGIRKLTDKLKSVGVQNVTAFEKNIRSTIGDDLEFGDMFLEGMFASSISIEVTLNESFAFYPTGKRKGPDYRVKLNGNHIFVEFTRFRVDEELRKNLTANENLAHLSKIPYGYEQIWSRIRSKLDQLVENEINLVVLYSTHDARGQHDFRHVARNYLDDENNEQLLKNLSGVLFAESGCAPEMWINHRTDKKFPEELIEPFRTAFLDMKYSLHLPISLHL